jgi:hypothetical protein
MRGWWKIPLAFVFVLLVIVVLVGATNRRARSREWCGLEANEPRSSQITNLSVDWTWDPPGFDCVYKDDRGHEVVRRRASAP